MGTTGLLVAAIWSYQNTWGQYILRAAASFRGAMQLHGGRDMPRLPSSASSARAPERLISSKWIPLMNQFNHSLLKAARFLPMRQQLSPDAVALPWPALGKI